MKLMTQSVTHNRNVWREGRKKGSMGGKECKEGGFYGGGGAKYCVE